MSIVWYFKKFLRNDPLFSWATGGHYIFWIFLFEYRYLTKTTLYKNGSYVDQWINVITGLPKKHTKSVPTRRIDQFLYQIVLGFHCPVINVWILFAENNQFWKFQHSWCERKLSENEYFRGGKLKAQSWHHWNTFLMKI